MSFSTAMIIGTIALGAVTLALTVYGIRLSLRAVPDPPRRVLDYYDVVKHARAIAESHWHDKEMA